jgi:hypothetical protein
VERLGQRVQGLVGHRFAPVDLFFAARRQSRVRTMALQAGQALAARRGYFRIGRLSSAVGISLVSRAPFRAPVRPPVDLGRGDRPNAGNQDRAYLRALGILCALLRYLGPGGARRLGTTSREPSGIRALFIFCSSAAIGVTLFAVESRCVYARMAWRATAAAVANWLYGVAGYPRAFCFSPAARNGRSGGAPVGASKGRSP